MSNDQSNFGATISSGIQDISALLPLLGTDQCERHSGAALERGYLYAAATPLSIFGSLGIVKTTFVTLLSTTTWPFTGARWLGDAGFQFESSLVAAKLVTLKKNTESTEYLAEAKLRALLDEQYIEDVERVSVTSSGWEWRPAADIPTSEDKSFPRAITSMPYSVQRWISRLPWNVALIVTTMVACSFSFAPYIYLIHSHPSPFVAWGFPFLRALGSLCSIVGMQLALQRRICRIMNCRLFFMILNKYYPESSPGQPCLVEQHLWQLFSSKSRFLSLRKCDVDSHTDLPPQPGNPASLAESLEDLCSVDWLLVIYRLSMGLGIGMVVVGYIGCFNLVNHTTAANGPYVWLGTEVILSIIRIALWGSNPKWDDAAGLKLEVALDEDRPTFTVHDLDHLVPINTGMPKAFKDLSFSIIPAGAFLTSVKAYVGPFKLPKLNDTHVYYAMLSQKTQDVQFLATTISDRQTCTTVFISVTSPPLIYHVYSANVHGPVDAMQVTLETDIFKDNLAIITNFHNLADIVGYSAQLARRLAGASRMSIIPLEWTLQEIADGAIGQPYMISLHYKKDFLEWAYSSMGNAGMAMKNMLDEMALIETLAIAENFIVELHLLGDHLQFTQTMAAAINNNPATQEYLSGLTARITIQKERFIERWHSLKPSRNDVHNVLWWTTITDMVNSNWCLIEEYLSSHSPASRLIDNIEFTMESLLSLVDHQYHYKPGHNPHFCSIVHFLSHDIGLRGYFPQPVTTGSYMRITIAIRMMINRLDWVFKLGHAETAPHLLDPADQNLLHTSYKLDKEVWKTIVPDLNLWVLDGLVAFKENTLEKSIEKIIASLEQFRLAGLNVFQLPTPLPPLESRSQFVSSHVIGFSFDGPKSLDWKTMLETMMEDLNLDAISDRFVSSSDYCSAHHDNLELESTLVTAKHHIVNFFVPLRSQWSKIINPIFTSPRATSKNGDELNPKEMLLLEIISIAESYVCELVLCALDQRLQYIKEVQSEGGNNLKDPSEDDSRHLTKPGIQFIGILKWRIQRELRGIQERLLEKNFTVEEQITVMDKWRILLDHLLELYSCNDYIKVDQVLEGIKDTLDQNSLALFLGQLNMDISELLQTQSELIHSEFQKTVERIKPLIDNHLDENRLTITVVPTGQLGHEAKLKKEKGKWKGKAKGKEKEKENEKEKEKEKEKGKQKEKEKDLEG